MATRHRTRLHSRDGRSSAPRELLHLHSILLEDYPLVERPSFARALSDVATSIGRQPRFDYLDPDDPGPFVRDVQNTVARVSSDWGIRRPSANV